MPILLSFVAAVALKCTQLVSSVISFVHEYTITITLRCVEAVYLFIAGPTNRNRLHNVVEVYTNRIYIHDLSFIMTLVQLIRMRLIGMMFYGEIIVLE